MQKQEMRINSLEAFRDALQQEYEEYRKLIGGIGFAAIETEILPEKAESLQDLFEGIRSIIGFSRDLNLIIDQSPTSIYVSDIEGRTLRINKYFEDTTGLSRANLLGRSNIELEKETLFDPSVGAIALREGRRVMVPQLINHDKQFVVAGVPVADTDGEIFGVVTNSTLSKETQGIGHYFEERRARKRECADREPKIIAASAKMQDILRLANVIKDTPSTILIEGETGVGKSLLARYIHYTGSRADQKMTEINCGAIPPALLESELFGYVSGAFTGAGRKGKAGLIESSNGGTILLDEISELPLALQVKLLHFLQNRRITRVGGTEEITVDVRVIAATNKSLSRLVKEEKFREDLYYRLNVVPITIPPLRERKEDIMPAVQLFADQFTRRYGKELSIEEKCREYILRQPWKGNMRELENFIERLVVTEGIVLIPEEDQTHDPWEVKTDPQDQGKEYSLAERREELKKNEREILLEAYRTYGSSYKVADALGMSQSTAYRKIRKYLQE
ncbi:MAG: sigma 54-interacting transcriptional regulator [Firmicutes bacterium]|nr:sigma 54-interacting transcriptional regulator [Bacillota bacterium]